MFSLVLRVFNGNATKFLKRQAKPCYLTSLIRFKSQNVFDIEEDDEENRY